MQTTPIQMGTVSAVATTVGELDGRLVRVETTQSFHTENFERQDRKLQAQDVVLDKMNRKLSWILGLFITGNVGIMAVLVAQIASRH